MTEEKPKRKPSATTLKVRAYAKFAKARARLAELDARQRRVLEELSAKIEKARQDMTEAKAALGEDE